MEKENHYQLELFSQIDGQGSSKKQVSHAFLRYIWAYEKAILITIGLLATGLVSFSLGVEKGKRLMMLKTDSRLDIALMSKQKYQPQQPVKSNTEGPINQNGESQLAIKNELKEYIEKYTIQVASYRARPHAQEEAEALKKRGLSTFVLSKGKFSIVCVGNFPKQEAARPLLTQLKKRYRDCYIRRL